MRTILKSHSRRKEPKEFVKERCLKKKKLDWLDKIVVLVTGIVIVVGVILIIVLGFCVVVVVVVLDFVVILRSASCR